MHPQSKGEGLLDSSRENVGSSSSSWRTNSQQPGPPASVREKRRWQSWAGRQSSSCAPTVTLAGTAGLADCPGHLQNQAYLTSLASHQEALRCSCLQPLSSCELCQRTCQRQPPGTMQWGWSRGPAADSHKALRPISVGAGTASTTASSEVKRHLPFLV